MAIRLVGRAVPSDYQASSTAAMTLWLPPHIEGDVHVLEVGCGAGVTMSVAGWTRLSRAVTGPSAEHACQEIWIKVVDAELAAEEEPIISVVFSQEAGEKRMGVQTLRGVDVSELMVSGIASNSSRFVVPPLGFGYAYAQVIEALARGELGVSYSYAKVIQDLTYDKFGAGFSYAKVIQDLEYELAASYAHAEVRSTDASQSEVSTESVASIAIPHPPDGTEKQRLVAAIVVGGSLEDLVLPTGWTLVLREARSASTNVPQLHIATYVTPDLPEEPPSEHVFALAAGAARMRGGLLVVGQQAIEAVASGTSSVSSSRFYTPNVDALEGGSQLVAIWTMWQSGRSGGFIDIIYNAGMDSRIRTAGHLAGSPEISIQTGIVDAGPTGTREERSVSSNIYEQVMASLIIAPTPPVTVTQVSSDVVRQGDAETRASQVGADVVRQGDAETRTSQISADVVIRSPIRELNRTDELDVTLTESPDVT